MVDQSLRGFLEMVERNHPEELVRIAEPVGREDITPTVFEFERAGRYPVIIFERVEGFEGSVVTNIAGNRNLLAACLDVEPGDLPTAYKDRCQNYLPVEVVEDAPWREVVIEEDEVDLNKLPIPFHFPVDAAPYITAGQIVARDPETGVDTTGFPPTAAKGQEQVGASPCTRGGACTTFTKRPRT